MDNQENNQEIKADKGKPKISLVPLQILTDVARVREFALKKYKSANSWKNVEIERYRDAMLRHMIAYIENPKGVDSESGLPHLSHLACNVAFLCEMEKGSTIEKTIENTKETSRITCKNCESGIFSNYTIYCKKHNMYVGVNDSCPEMLKKCGDTNAKHT